MGLRDTNAELHDDTLSDTLTTVAVAEQTICPTCPILIRLSQSPGYQARKIGEAACFSNLILARESHFEISRTKNMYVSAIFRLFRYWHAD